MLILMTMTAITAICNRWKLYALVVTLSTQDDKKLLQLKTNFKRIIRWNEYRSKMTNQHKNKNLNYLIDLTV